MRFPDIHPAAWEHPTDRAALGALQKIPGFDRILRKVIGTFGEKNVRMMFQANAVKVSETQYPELHQALVRVCDVLDTPVPPLYITQDPTANAGAVGVDNPFIVLHSSLIELATPFEVEAVLGHEVGHVMSGHALYRTMLFILLQLTLMRSPMITVAMRPIIYALLEWSRKAEISCDRAGLLAVQDPDASLGVLGVLAGGIRDERFEINLEAFIEQSDEYRDAEGLAAYYKFVAMLGRSHPFAVVRVAELRNWIESGDYHEILGGEFRTRSDPDDLTGDISTAATGFGTTAVKVLEDTERYVNKTMDKLIDRIQRTFNEEPIDDDDDDDDSKDDDAAYIDDWPVPD